MFERIHTREAELVSALGVFVGVLIALFLIHHGPARVEAALRGTPPVVVAVAARAADQRLTQALRVDH